jgi:hypothetical protein
LERLSTDRASYIEVHFLLMSHDVT